MRCREKGVIMATVCPFMDECFSKCEPSSTSSPILFEFSPKTGLAYTATRMNLRRDRSQPQKSAYSVMPSYEVSRRNNSTETEIK